MNALDLFEKLVSIQEKGTRAAVATVIRTEGSTPRKTGAKMIIYPDGQIFGTIRGGCGEGEVIEKAFIVMDRGSPCSIK